MGGLTNAEADTCYEESFRGTRLIGTAALIVIVLAGLARGATVVDTEEMLWPDPRDRTAVHLGALSHALQAYAQEHGELPATLAAVPPPLNRADEWGGEIRYHRDGPVFSLRSAGPDRQFGTPDDIVIEDGTTYASKRALYLRGQDSLHHTPPI